jgi:antirestriction protein ArdC
MIGMPPLPSFNEAGSYYVTLLHELGLDRPPLPVSIRNLTRRFCSRAYAAEESIAQTDLRLSLCRA